MTRYFHKKSIKRTIKVIVISMNLRFMNLANKFMGTRFPDSRESRVMPLSCFTPTRK